MWLLEGRPVLGHGGQTRSILCALVWCGLRVGFWCEGVSKMDLEERRLGV